MAGTDNLRSMHHLVPGPGNLVTVYCPVYVNQENKTGTYCQRVKIAKNKIVTWHPNAGKTDIKDGGYYIMTSYPMSVLYTLLPIDTLLYTFVVLRGF